MSVNLVIWKCRVTLINRLLGLDYRYEYWLSGSDLGKTEHFVWITSGKPLDDNMTDVGHCVKMRQGGKRLKFNCSELIYFICENRDWQWNLENVIGDPK